MAGRSGSFADNRVPKLARWHEETEVHFVSSNKNTQNIMEPWKYPFSLDELYRFYSPEEVDAFSTWEVLRLLAAGQVRGDDSKTGLRNKLYITPELQQQRNVMEALYERLNWAEDYAVRQAWESNTWFGLTVVVMVVLLLGWVLGLAIGLSIFFAGYQLLGILLGSAIPLIWSVVF